jgi:hypothetical protein
MRVGRGERRRWPAAFAAAAQCYPEEGPAATREDRSHARRVPVAAGGAGAGERVTRGRRGARAQESA